MRHCSGIMHIALMPVDRGMGTMHCNGHGNELSSRTWLAESFIVYSLEVRSELSEGFKVMDCF